MKELAQSKNYKILHEYETVLLQRKDNDKLVIIGDFYGDPQVAIISELEKFCVVGGCGIIIYYLKEPYEKYSYNINSLQWKEWGREDEESTVWVNNIKYIDEESVEIETEDFEKIIISIY